MPYTVTQLEMDWIIKTEAGLIFIFFKRKAAPRFISQFNSNIPIKNAKNNVKLVWVKCLANTCIILNHLQTYLSIIQGYTTTYTLYS